MFLFRTIALIVIRDQIANILWSMEKASLWSMRKQGSSRKTSTSTSLTMLKPLTVWITTNCGKFLKRWEYQTIYLSPEKPVFGSRSKSELDLEERADSKLGKEYDKARYCHPD